MFKSVLQSIMQWLSGPTLHQNLEAYIVAGNPQTADDVERLERSFYETRQRNALWQIR